MMMSSIKTLEERDRLAEEVEGLRKELTEPATSFFFSNKIENFNDFFQFK